MTRGALASGCLTSVGYMAGTGLVVLGIANGVTATLQI